MSVFDVLREKLEDICKTGCKKDFDLGLCRNYENCIDCITSKIRDKVDKIEQEYNNGWIPCSERLPKYTDEYNVTVDVASEMGCYRKVTTLRFENIKGTMPIWIIPKGEVYRIIAWQPLPPKYEPKGENNDY